MDASHIELLKQSIDKPVEIETRAGERLVARVLFVTHSEEYDEHEVLYELVYSNMLDFYKHRETAGGYVLDFDDIVSVKPYQGL